MSAATIDVSAELQRQSLSSLMRQMERARRDVGKDLGQSVKFAAWAVADALRTATAIAPKRRPVREIGADISDRRKIFEVEGMKRGHAFRFQIRATDKRAAIADKRVNIANSGLAQKSWHLSQSRLGSGRGGKKVAPRTQALAQHYGSVEIRIKSDDPWVRIENRLPYASDAFKGGGDQVVSNVMERAARRMAHVIDGQIARKMGAK